ncbi:MAG: hypothetical protein HKO75_08700, partial [Flavobacteriaceae bacterium]|nr:hypothetical protein [Muriicola sp.]NNL39924.1 hypothetical protein [Flavobacteriaceae bacterium]
MRNSFFKRMAILAGAGVAMVACTDDTQTFDNNFELQNSSPLDAEVVTFNQGSYEIEGSYIVVFNRKVTGDVGAK